MGPAICTYTAALICDTAVPAWHEAHREMPYLFAGSAATAAGGLGMMAVPAEDAGQAIRFAVLGAATELTAKSLLLRRLGETGEPYQTGRSGKLMEAAEVLTAAGLAGAVLAGRSRAAIMLSGAALVASSALTRFGIFEAGRVSARDPKYTVRPQRERLAAKAPASLTRRVPDPGSLWRCFPAWGRRPGDRRSPGCVPGVLSSGPCLGIAVRGPAVWESPVCGSPVCRTGDATRVSMSSSGWRSCILAYISNARRSSGVNGGGVRLRGHSRRTLTTLASTA